MGIVLVWVLSLAAFVLPVAVGAEERSPLDPVVARLTDHVLSEFPKVEGLVVKAEADRIYITLGARHGVRAGMKLTVLRKGEALRHPQTGELIGHVEEEVGQVQLQQVQEAYSSGQASLKAPHVAVQVGDTVRLSAGKIRLVLFPIRSEPGTGGSAQMLFDRLAVALNATGRFEVPPPESVLIKLLEQGVTPEAPLRKAALPEIGKRFRADYGLLGRLTSLGGRVILESQLVTLGDQREVRTVSVFVPQLGHGTEPAVTARVEKAPPPPERPERALQPLPQPVRVAPESTQQKKQVPGPAFIGERGAELPGEGIWKSPPIDLAVQGMDIGDVNGNGKNDIVLVGPNAVHVYRMEGTTFQERYRFTERQLEGLVGVDLVDLNGNGRAEMFVTAVARGEARSFVLEENRGRLQKIAEELRLLFRVVHLPGEGAVLVAQKVERPEGVSRAIYRVMRRAGRYETGQKWQG